MLPPSGIGLQTQRTISGCSTIELNPALNFLTDTTFGANVEEGRKDVLFNNILNTLFTVMY